jgi:hypothetical protein
MSCVQLLPLCSTPKVATRESMTGATAYMNLIGGNPDGAGNGYWFASGQRFFNPGSQAVQDASRTYQGTVKPDTYTKGFSCLVPAACPAV